MIVEVKLLPNVRLTRIQQILFDKLSDGEKHPVEELLPLIDGQATKSNLNWHIANLRDAIYDSGYLIAAHTMGYRGTTHLQMVGRLRIRID